jgi:hypothetical protein
MILKESLPQMTKRLRKIPLKTFPFTPSKYPGRRPRFSFLFTRKGLYRLKLRTLDSVLAKRGLALASERYAVLAYGSNACPGQLLEKELDDVPVIFGRLIGADAVYARRTTQRSYVPATLARKDGEGSNWITLLTRDQLGMMDKTEGRRGNTYAFAKLSNVRFRVGRKHYAPLYAYVNITGGVMTIDGSAVALRSMSQRRAKSVLENSVGQDATECLDFETIEYPKSPARYSQVMTL